LAFGADIQQAAAKCHHHRQPGKDQRRGVSEHDAKIFYRAERTREHYPDHPERIVTDQSYDDPAQHKRS